MFGLLCFSSAHAHRTKAGATVPDCVPDWAGALKPKMCDLVSGPPGQEQLPALFRERKQRQKTEIFPQISGPWVPQRPRIGPQTVLRCSGHQSVLKSPQKGPRKVLKKVLKGPILSRSPQNKSRLNRNRPGKNWPLNRKKMEFPE